MKAVLAALAPAVMQPRADAPRVTQREFKRLVVSANVIILDTRAPQEFAAGHIRGAILLPLGGRLYWSNDDQQRVVEKLETAKKPIVAYCA
jgi:rhodanese-related sulfurtransferase